MVCFQKKVFSISNPCSHEIQCASCGGSCTASKFLDKGSGFGFDFNVQISPKPMRSGQGFGPPREDEKLHLVELCAGSHRLTYSAVEFGLSALALDVTSHFFEKWEDWHWIL